MEKKRIAYLDALKGLCILCVVEGHVLSTNGFKPYDSLSSMMLYSFGLPIFFVISGFLAYKPSMAVKDVWDNIYKKFMFLVIPAVIFRMALSMMHHKNVFSFIVDGMGGYWFTAVLFECFLIYYLVMLVIKNDKWRIGILIALSLAGLMVKSIDEDFGPAIIDLHRLSKLFQFFVVGLLARKYREQYESLMQNEIMKVVLLVTFFSVLFSMTYPMHPVLHRFLRDVVLRYFGTFALISLFTCHDDYFRRENKINALINYLGQKSLAIYLLHYFFLPKFLPRPEWFNGLNMVTVHLLALLYAVAITALCLVFIEFLSYSKYIRKYAFGQK